MATGAQLVDPTRPWVRIDVLEARGFFERTHGLIDAESVGAGRGLLLRARQVHTLGMTFPIDTVYISRKGTVIKIKTIKPWRIGPLVLRARWVMEMDAGEAARRGIGPGTRLVKTSLG